MISLPASAGDGSIDQSITLQPGEVQAVEVAFHAQDAGEAQYAVKFKLTADETTPHPIISYAEATVLVNQPGFSMLLEEIGADPYTLVNTFRLTNTGDTLTDVRVISDDASRPALIFAPIIEHHRMEQNDVIEFSVAADQELSATIIATGASGQVTLATLFGCAPDTDPYTVVVDNPTICREVRGGYCTNRPRLNIPFTLPEGLQMTDVNKSALYTEFQPRSGWRHRPHDVDIAVNRNPVLSLHNTIPEGLYSSAFPPWFLNYSEEGAAGNAIQVNTRHMNGGHYVVATGFTVALGVERADGGDGVRC